MVSRRRGFGTISKHCHLLITWTKSHVKLEEVSWRWSLVLQGCKKRSLWHVLTVSFKKFSYELLCRTQRSESFQTSKMDIFAKRSIVDTWQGSECTYGTLEMNVSAGLAQNLQIAYRKHK